VGFLVTWFIPQWKDILFDLGLKPDQLPAPTKLLIDISDAVKYHWWVVLIVVGILIVAWRMFTSTRFGRRVADRMKLKV
ncbi:hypothetical protein ABTN25_20535, partial [Acinetobacter baumannii]